MADKIHILGQRLSPFFERVYLQAEVKGLLGQIEIESWRLSEIKDPEYLAINPLGKMPVLRMADFILYESTVIMEFLEERFPEKPLLPEDPEARARVRLIIRLLDLYYHPHTVAIMTQVFLKDRDQKYIDYHVGKARAAMKIIEGLIEGGEYAVGGAMTLADTTLFASCFLGKTFAPGFGQDYFEDLSKLKAWYQKMCQKEVFKASNQVRGTELAEFMAEAREKENAA